MYLEVLLGILLLAIVAGGVIEGFAAASSQIGKTRLDVVASKIAQQHLEDIRNMSYSSVGIVGGNPTGTISASQTQTVNGTAYTV
jgi:type II secretory pathway pseudopilin PulG